jgi:membrane fusion protein
MSSAEAAGSAMTPAPPAAPAGSGGPAGLFRREAVANRASRLGRAAVALPLPTWLVTLLLAGIIAALGAFLTLGSYARKETVLGYVTPTGGAADVYASRSGVVASVYAELGDRVAAGERLFAVREAGELPLGGDVASGVGDHIERQIAHLTAERDSVVLLYQHKLDRLDHLLLATAREATRAAGMLALARQQLTLAERSLQARETLAHAQAISTDQLRQAQGELLSLQVNHQRAEMEWRQLQSRLPELRLQRAESASDGARQAAALDVRLEALRGQVIEWRARQALVTVAPIAGVVAFSQVATGQAASVSKPAMTIVPDDAGLEVRLLIPSRAKAFVEPGQAVRIMYDAFPYQQFGVHEGVMAGVSGSALPGHEVLGPLASGEAVYLGTVRLPRDHFAAYGRRYRVQPGMTVRADIVLADRRLIAWLLEPLLRVRG